MTSESQITDSDLELLLARIEVDSMRRGHRILADHIAALYRLCSRCVMGAATRRQVLAEFESLIEVCARQFRLESELMEYSRYVRAAPHRLDHERFLSLLDLHYRALERAECGSACRELLSGTAPRWHQQHIRNHDLIMAEHVAAYTSSKPIR
jgi:hemerythrin